MFLSFLFFGSRSESMNFTSGNTTVSLDASHYFLRVTPITGTNGQMDNYRKFSDPPWHNWHFTIRNVTIDEGVTLVGRYCFCQIYHIKDIIIPNTVKKLETYAFYSCNELQHAFIPASVVSIAYNAFLQCPSLLEIKIDQNNQKYTNYQNDGLLYDKKMTTLISCPGGKPGNIEIPDAVTAITKYAFFYEKSMTSVKLPINITRIEEFTFCACSKLQNITVPPLVSKISKDAFNLCVAFVAFYVDEKSEFFSSNNGLLLSKDGTRLVFSPHALEGSVIIPDSVEIIGDYSFASSSVHYVSLPSKIREISKYSFSSCKYIEKITLPASLEIIGEHAFQGCVALSKIFVDEKNKKFSNYQNDGIIYNKACTSIILCPTGMKGKLIVPNSVITAEEYSIASCLIEEIKFQRNFSILTNHSIFDCNSLIKVSFPETLSSIGDKVFYRCYSLISILIDEKNQIFSNYQKDGIIYDKNISTVIFVPQGRKDTVFIPSTVKEIGSNSFYNCKLTNVILNSGISIISNEAFSFCMSLKSIIIPDTVSQIGEKAFYYCNTLSNVTYCGIQNIQYNKQFLSTLVEKVNVPSSYLFDEFCGINVNKVAASDLHECQIALSATFEDSDREVQLSFNTIFMISVIGACVLIILIVIIAAYSIRSRQKKEKVKRMTTINSMLIE